MLGPQPAETRTAALRTNQAFHLNGEAPRVSARGRFLFVGAKKLWVRGVTYGTFRPDSGAREYPTGARLETDLAGIVSTGFNAIRTYTVPPRDVLDAAWRHGVRVLVGLP